MDVRESMRVVLGMVYVKTMYVHVQHTIVVKDAKKDSVSMIAIIEVHLYFAVYTSLNANNRQFKGYNIYNYIIERILVVTKNGLKWFAVKKIKNKYLDQFTDTCL